MSKSKSSVGDHAIYDARKELTAGQIGILGFQHVFAMFGATVLVPILTGLSVSATLLWAGLGTLLFHLITKKKVPAFLGSSFAFLAGYAAIAPNKEPELLRYACFGVAVAGLAYLVLAASDMGYDILDYWIQEDFIKGYVENSVKNKIVSINIQY